MTTAQRARNLSFFMWALTIVVTVVAVLSWHSSLGDTPSYSLYSFFPLFGIIAFSLMWTHFIGRSLRLHLRVPKNTLHSQFVFSSRAVLVLILLHPSIFIGQLWKDGFGLPPGSYLSVYAIPAERIAIILGTLSLFVFLSFELYRFFKKARWWRFVEYANIAAMLAIFYHALQLGGALQINWFRVIWWFYGISFVIAVLYYYVARRKES